MRMKVFSTDTSVVRFDAIWALQYNFDDVNPAVTIYLLNGTKFWDLASSDQEDAENLIKSWEEWRASNT